MPARRRFHGYCPPAARRTTNAVVFGALDDYTSTLSGMHIHVGKINHLMEVSFLRESCAASMDDDDDDSSVADIIQSVVMEMCRRKDDFQSVSHAIVTSQSYDSGGGMSSTREGNRLLSHHEEDGVRDFTFLSGRDNAKFSDAFTSESASVASSVSLEISDNESGDLPQRSFVTFRINYLIVTTAIMLADGLQGESLVAFSTILRRNAYPLTCCQSLVRYTSICPL